METELDAFLTKRITYHPTNYTHQSVYAQKKYIIQDDERDMFWQLYMNHIDQGKFISLCERPRPGGYSTIRGDFDIKIPESESAQFLTGTHLYKKQEVLLLVEMYMDVLKKHVLNLTNEQLMCCILEKSGPSVSSDGYIKSGFHIEFPFLLCARDEQRAFLFPKLEKVYKDSSFFTRYDAYAQNIFDKSAVTSNAWMVYGSKKGIDKEAYSLSCIVNSDLEEISLADMMAVHYIRNQDDEVITVEDNDEWPMYLPQIMSTTEKGKIKYMRELKNCDYTLTTQNLPRLPVLDRDQEKMMPSNPTEALREARSLLPLLSNNRAADFKTWFEIGCLLWNISDGSIDGLETWIEFSKRTPLNNFSEAACVSRWHKMKKSMLTVGTIMFYARLDNPEEYNKYRQANSKKSLMDSVRKNGTLTSYSCAEALYHKYKNEFVYTGNGKDGWYKFENHRWVQIAEGIELRKLIPTLREPIMEEIKRIRDRITGVENGRRDREEANEDAGEEAKQVKELDKQRSMLLKEKNKLEDTPFKDKILKECKDLFLDQEFLLKINTNVNLMGFTNGVLDVEALEFREGRSIDYITLSTNYDFREVPENSEEMRQIDDYLQRVFVKPEIRNYFLDTACAILKGGNITKKVVVWSGVGDNSKSVLVTLVRKMLGMYFHEFPTSLLVGKRTQSSGASPEVAGSAGTRFAVIQEPSEREEFNVGLLKELSGNDTIYTRALYRDSSSFLPQFKLTVICNKLPRIPSDDQATWNRIRVLDFESKFLDESECPKTFEEQMQERKFPIDRSFTFTEKMVQAFIYKLFMRFKSIQKKGFVMNEPEQVTAATKRYRAKNDIFMNFINDKLKDDHESSLTIADLYGSFKDWHKTSYTSACTASRPEFKEYFERCYKLRFQGNKINGIRYLTEEDQL
jgi:P4 family phage/plasmid primase-like protien